MSDMVDTIRLLLAMHNPLVLDGSRFNPTSLEGLVRGSSFGKTALNPSQTYAKMGKSMPRLTMFKRPSKTGPVYQLAVEFSAPKMLYDNNFDEVREADFDAILIALQDRIQELLGYKFFKHQLAEAEVGAWHPSKNVVFLDYTSCQTILNTIGKLDVSRIYDWQKTDFRDGHVVHIHCNSLDIAFYDKMADLRKAKVSDKRAFEKGSQVQISLLDDLTDGPPVEVFRYEVRYVGRASIKRGFSELDKWTFETLFKKDLCQKALQKHWLKLVGSIDMLSLDERRPYELFQNYLIDNPDATPQAALAAVTGLLINGQEGVVNLRNLLEARYGKQAWYRLKPLLKAPTANRLSHFQHITENLERFEPTSLTSYIKSIESSGK